MLSSPSRINIPYLSLFLPLPWYSVSASNYSSASTSLTADFHTSRSIYSCFKHCCVTRFTVPRSPNRHRSIIGWVAMYWDMVFWRWRTYISTSSITDASTASSKGGYYHRSIVSHLGSSPTRQRSILWWNPPRVSLILGVISCVSNTNNRVTWTTAFYKMPEVHALDPSQPKILDNLAYLLRAFFILLTTTRQSYPNLVRTPPRYLKEVTASKGLTYAWKAAAVLAWASSYTRRLNFWSAPLALIAMVRCLLFNTYHGRRISNCGHNGRKQLPYFRTTIFPRTQQCMNWTQRAPYFTTSPQNLSYRSLYSTFGSRRRSARYTSLWGDPHGSIDENYLVITLFLW